ncbi:MAG: hypothetical protein CMJ52_03655 [Planctomycetaceae bacterium]|nr:hypothetical protein [Planctomycetaceae bacterium]
MRPGLPLLIIGMALAGCDRPSGDPPTPDVSRVEPSKVDDGRRPVEWEDVVSGDGRWRIAWRPVGGSLPVSEPCAIELRITDASGRPVGDDVEVVFDAEMPHHGHGMNVEPRVTRGEGGWSVEGILLHMPGRWEASVDLVADGEIERAQWTLDIER